MKAGRFISTLVGMSFLGSALAFGFWPQKQAKIPKDITANIVKVGRVTQSDIERQVRLSGITQAAEQAVLAFTMSARIDRRYVEVGARVARGDRLAILDVRQYDNAVASARARKTELEVRLAQAERDRRRFAVLRKDEVVPLKDYERVAADADSLRAGLQAATAGLQEARRIRSEAELRAPFDGIITAVYLEPGEWATAGQPVVEISGDGPVELEIDVPERFIEHLSTGQKVEVTLPFAADRRLQGQIVAVTRAALSSGRLFPVVVALPQTAPVIPGMTAEITLNVSLGAALSVPIDAIVNPGSSTPSIFVVAGEKARRVSVTLGPFSEDQVLVTGDVAAGDRVVVAGHTMLTDGARVVVK
jgi:RND family efflux transporter MFP subunit